MLHLSPSGHFTSALCSLLFLVNLRRNPWVSTLRSFFLHCVNCVPLGEKKKITVSLVAITLKKKIFYSKYHFFCFRSCVHSLPPLAQPAAGHIVSSDELSAYLGSALGSGSHTVLLFLQKKVCFLLFHHMPYQRNWKWKMSTSAYRVKFVLKFHGFHNMP